MIDNIDFINLETEKFWSFPKSYKGNKQEETKQMILSGTMMGSEKKDGHYCRLIKDMEGNIRMQGRTKSVSGEYLDKHEFVPQLQEFFDWLPNGTVFLGELYFPNKRGSRNVTTILGCLKDKAIDRQNKGDKLYYYVFDIWALNGSSYIKKTMEQRVNTLNELATNFKEQCDCPYVVFARYSEGKELWDELGEILANDGEGIVITKKDSIPEPGKRTARKTLKVKKEIEQTIDVFLDGEYKSPTRLYTGKEIESWELWENFKTSTRVNKNMFTEYCNGEPWEPVTKNYFYGRAAAVSISVMKDGKPYHIGYISGITDEMRDGIVNCPENYINRVYEITCMEINYLQGKYSLRHAKFVKERPDKNYQDCDFSQISE